MESRDKSLWVLYMINFVANTSYAVGLPLFPPLAASKGVDESVIGYIYALYPFGCIGVSFILGHTFKVASSKNVISLSY